MRHRGRVVRAVTVFVGVAVVVAGCGRGGGGSGGDRDLARDCMQNPGGVPGVSVPPSVADLPTHFGNPSNPHAMGREGVLLRIRPVPSVHTIRKECFANKIGYFAAMIEFAPGATGTLTEWNNWTEKSGPAYLFVHGPAQAPNFAYEIYTKDPTSPGKLVKLSQGQGFWWGDPNAQLDAASIGEPAPHQNDASYLRKLREVGGDSMAAVAARERERQEGHPRAAKPLDDPNAWFNCAQGCCTATAIM